MVQAKNVKASAPKLALVVVVRNHLLLLQSRNAKVCNQRIRALRDLESGSKIRDLRSDQKVKESMERIGGGPFGKQRYLAQFVEKKYISKHNEIKPGTCDLHPERNIFQQLIGFLSTKSIRTRSGREQRPFRYPVMKGSRVCLP